MYIKINNNLHKSDKHYMLDVSRVYSQLAFGLINWTVKSENEQHGSLQKEVIFPV